METSSTMCKKKNDFHLCPYSFIHYLPPSTSLLSVTVISEWHKNVKHPFKLQGPLHLCVIRLNLINLVIFAHFCFYCLGFEDYVNFLCSLPNVDPAKVKAATAKECNLSSLTHPWDLNLPSVTISALNGSQLTQRKLMNVASYPETYLCTVLQPEGVSVSMSPTWFTVGPEQTQDLEIKLSVTQALNSFSFGEIVLTGSLNDIVRVSLSVFPIAVAC